MIRLLLALLLFPAALLAAALEEPLPDPAQEKAAQALFREVRCVVCQSESVGESASPFAADLRAEIRRRIQRGEAPQTILQSLSRDYGEAIRLTPVATLANAGLWILPLAAFLFGAWLLRRQFGR